MQILVTGGAGFIGSNIIEYLLSKNIKVIAFDNLSTGRFQNIAEFTNNPNFNFIEADLRDASAVNLACQGVDYVIHQGALPSVPRSVQDPITTNNVNINGTLNILEAAKKHKVKRLICASSSSVYGNNPVLPKHENMPVMPVSPYALTKYAQEKYCQIYTELYNLETVSLRYFNVFGPKQDPTSQYSAVIPKFINAIIDEKTPEIYGDGSTSRDFTFVMNNVEANFNACFHEGIAGNVFNIAVGERYTLIDLVNEINRILNKNIEPIFLKERAGDVKHSQADVSKIKEMMNFSPSYSFREGLEKTVEHFLKLRT
jgi:nucleoside-diphosphate-sugar epimerase